MSMRHFISLVENTNPHLKSIEIQKIINALLNTSMLDLAVTQLENLDLKDRDILDVLTPYAKPIVDNITKNKRMPPYVIYEMMLLMRLGARWPELIDAIASNKSAIVRYIMTVRDHPDTDTNALYELYTDIERLQSIGINWPDLKIIKKSIDADLDHKPSLTEAHPAIPPKIVKQFQREYSNIPTDGVNAITNTVIKLKATGATDQQIASLFSERRNEVAQVIQDCLSNNKSYASINNALYSIRALSSVGIKWPTLLQILNQFEDKITTWAIAGAFDFRFYKTVLDTLAVFEKLGFNTDNIKNELKKAGPAYIIRFLENYGFSWHLGNLIDEFNSSHLLPFDFNEQQLDVIFSEFLDHVKHYGFHTERFADLVRLINDINKIKSYFEANKGIIVSTMIHDMTKLNSHTMANALEILHKLNIKWPEIRIFTKSMKADSKL